MKQLIAILLLSSLYSCDFPKHYFDAPILCEDKLQFNFDEEHYDLGKINEIISDSQPSDFRYYFETFLLIDGNDYMIVNFRNEKVCMDVRMRVKKLGKLSGMKRTNGKSYPKELYDLEWTTELNSGLLELYYKDMRDIND